MRLLEAKGAQANPKVDTGMVFYFWVCNAKRRAWPQRSSSRSTACWKATHLALRIVDSIAAY